MPLAPPPPRILSSSIEYLAELTTRRGPGGAVFVLNNDLQPGETFEAAVIFFHWGERRATRERKLLEAELALLEKARLKPRVAPSSLPFFQQEWKDARQRVFMVDDSIGPLDLFTRLSRFMRWTREDRHQYQLELGKDLADHIDTNFGTLEGLRDILRQYNERRGKIRWKEADIATMRLTTCKQLIKKHIHVNIHDYTSRSDRQFVSYAQLKAYTLGNHRFFPLDAAKVNGLTAVLLKDFSGKRGGRRNELSELMGNLTL